MRNINRIGFIGLAFTAALTANAGTYKLTITNNSAQPLSPLYFAASSASFDIFKTGTAASAGIKAIAEGGNTVPMLAITDAAGSAIGTRGVLGSSPLGTGLSRTLFFDTDDAHTMFSFASMLGKTNDGFIGESVSSLGLNLLGGPIDLIVLGNRAWDAGTEKNTQNAADLGFKGGSGNPAEDAGFTNVRVHGGILAGIGDSEADMPKWALDTNVARIQVQAVPEPGTIATLVIGLIAAARMRRRA